MVCVSSTRKQTETNTHVLTHIPLSKDDRESFSYSNGDAALICCLGDEAFWGFFSSADVDIGYCFGPIPTL